MLMSHGLRARNVYVQYTVRLHQRAAPARQAAVAARRGLPDSSPATRSTAAGPRARRTSHPPLDDADQRPDRRRPGRTCTARRRASRSPSRAAATARSSATTRCTGCRTTRLQDPPDPARARADRHRLLPVKQGIPVRRGQKLDVTGLYDDEHPHPRRHGDRARLHRARRVGEGPLRPRTGHRPHLRPLRRPQPPALTPAATGQQTAKLKKQPNNAFLCQWTFALLMIFMRLRRGRRAGRW